MECEIDNRISSATKQEISNETKIRVYSKILTYMNDKVRRRPRVESVLKTIRTFGTNGRR